MPLVHGLTIMAKQFEYHNMTPPPPPPPHPQRRWGGVYWFQLDVFSYCVCMLFLFGWPPCQRSDMTLMEVSQRALDSLYIRNIWLLYIVMFFVNLIWYLYQFWLNKHCLSLRVWVWVNLSTCIFNNTSRIHLYILSTNFRMCFVWNILSKLKKIELLAIFLNL